MYALLSLLGAQESAYLDFLPNYSIPANVLFINLTSAYCAIVGLDAGWETVQPLAGALWSGDDGDIGRVRESIQKNLKRWGATGANHQYVASLVVSEVLREGFWGPECRDGG